MFFRFLEIPIRPLIDRLLRWCFRRLSFLKTRFLLQLLLESRILVFPVANCPGYRDDAGNSSILNETASFLYSFQFSWLIRFVVVRKLNELAVFQA
jgi:hypothetical protein